MAHKIITITGELGSGKSTVSRRLSEMSGIRRYATGDAQRKIAAARGMTTLELNLLSEKDPTIDQEIDSIFASLAESGEDLVVDSRMAWHFLPDSVRVKLLVAPREAAHRVYQDGERVSEETKTVDDVYAKLAMRRTSERRRFLSTYGVDIEDNKNFDYVIDTTGVDPVAVAALIYQLSRTGARDNKFWIGPRLLYPTKSLISGGSIDGDDIRKAIRLNGFDHRFPVQVAHKGRNAFIVDGHRRVDGALRTALPIIPFIPVTWDVRTDGGLIREWEVSHDFRFRSYPDV